eukprot:6607514-Ditylum_brightwellii.AAC.1
MELEIKRSNRMNAIFENNLAVSRNPQKGYSATLASFIEANVPDGPTGSPVDVINSNSAAVYLLWKFESVEELLSTYIKHEPKNSDEDGDGGIIDRHDKTIAPNNNEDEDDDNTSIKN